MPPAKIGSDIMGMGKNIVYDNPGDTEMSRLREIAELDVNAGLALVGAAEAIYKSTLKIIAKKIPTITQTMTDCLENDDFGRFAIDIHSVKSSLAAAGAHELSKKALDMELAAKAGNTAFCREKFPRFASQFLDLGEKLRHIFTTPDAASSQESGEPRLKAQLAEIGQCLEEFDGDTALEILAQLTKEDFNPEINRLFVALNEQIDMFEYEIAKTTLDDLQKLILPP